MDCPMVQGRAGGKENRSSASAVHASFKAKAVLRSEDQSCLLELRSIEPAISGAPWLGYQYMELTPSRSPTLVSGNTRP